MLSPTDEWECDFATLPATTFVQSEFLWSAHLVCNLRRWPAGRFITDPVCCMFLRNAAHDVLWFEVVLLSSNVYLGWHLIIRATSSNWDLTLKTTFLIDVFLGKTVHHGNGSSWQKFVFRLGKTPPCCFCYWKNRCGRIWSELSCKWVHPLPHNVM